MVYCIPTWSHDGELLNRGILYLASISGIPRESKRPNRFYMSYKQCSMRQKWREPGRKSDCLKHFLISINSYFHCTIGCVILSYNIIMYIYMSMNSPLHIECNYMMYCCVSVDACKFTPSWKFPQLRFLDSCLGRGAGRSLACPPYFDHRCSTLFHHPSEPLSGDAASPYRRRNLWSQEFLHRVADTLQLRLVKHCRTLYFDSLLECYSEGVQECPDHISRGLHPDCLGSGPHWCRTGWHSEGVALVPLSAGVWLPFGAWRAHC